jgi:hypothetical protein
MKNSNNEKYGETTGAKAGIYSVEGSFSEQIIGRQKVSSPTLETEPVS